MVPEMRGCRFRGETAWMDLMDKKLVYTLTFHEVLNVGAVLQAYALQKFLQGAGYDSQVLNYRPPYFLWQIYRPAKGLRRAIAKLATIRKFRAFRKAHLEMSPWQFHGPSGLKRAGQAHAVVCGSDQVWNRYLTGGDYDPVFFLDGVGPARKIAYGASSGGRSLQPGRAVVEPYLRAFDAIGVREEFLRRDIVDSGMVDRADVVVDPTFLLSDYEAVIDRRMVPEGGRYIASYEVSDDESRRHFAERVAAIKEKLGLPVVHLGAKPIACADTVYGNLSPGEWLGLISKAHLVCTNSFHGVALSLNLRRGLAFVPHVDPEKNVRVLGLLDHVGLGHLVVGANSFDADGHIDYQTAGLEAAIARSKAFLIDSLA